MTKTILVTGATGAVGSSLVPRLLANDNVSVRAFVRSIEKGAALENAGASLAIGAFEDTASIAKAVEGIDTVVLITAPNADAVQQSHNVIVAAKEAGVRKIVRLSAINAAADGPTDNTRQHAKTEKEIADSGLTYVFIQPHYFLNNLFYILASLLEAGEMYYGMGDGKMSMIDVRDIVDSLESAVISDEFDNQSFLITGPETITFYDVANKLTEVIGRTFTYVPITPEAVAQSIRDMGWGDWGADVMRDYSQAYSDGWGDFITNDVEKLTGHTARSLDDFVREVFAPAIAQATAQA